MRLKAVLFVAISSSCLACGSNDRDQPEAPYYVPLPSSPWSLERLPVLDAPEVIPFGIVPIGQEETREFVVANRGRAPLNISAWNLEGPFAVRVSSGGEVGGEAVVERAASREVDVGLET